MIVSVGVPVIVWVGDGVADLTESILGTGVVVEVAGADPGF